MSKKMQCSTIVNVVVSLFLIGFSQAQDMKISTSSVASGEMASRYSGEISIDALKTTLSDPNLIYTHPLLSQIKVPVTGFEIRNGSILDLQKLGENFHVIKIRLGGGIVIGGVNENTISDETLGKNKIVFFCNDDIAEDLQRFSVGGAGYRFNSIVVDIHVVKYGDQESKALKFIYGESYQYEEIGDRPGN